MRLTTKGRYAVTAMLDMTLYGSDTPVRLAEIAARQAISLPYLEQLFAKLRAAALVQSSRGPGGGYRLARPAEAISLAAVIEAVNESVDATQCGGAGTCRDGDVCLTHFLWADLGAVVQQFLGSINLAQLAARPDVQRVFASQGPQQLKLEPQQASL